eukprot:GHVT01098011.1.p1 GENE.GHVT01098011.1~~GHVT01098011.1.p1  ORF type:complete len:518 (+),score=17.30 GHVT01098011.1:56-1609(+)
MALHRTSAILALLMIFLPLPVLSSLEEDRQCKDCVISNMEFDCGMAHCEQFPTDIDSYVQIIKLQDNNIDEIPVLEYEDLIELYLTNNNISTIAPKAFQKCIGLKKLYLNGNQIERLDSHHFDGPLGLTHLFLNSNHIKYLATDTFPFPYFPELQHLELSMNDLTYIEVDAFTDLAKLTYLDLSHNNLTQLKDRDFRGLEVLHHLDLSKNRISTITESVFFPLAALNTLVLSQNGLHQISNYTFKGLTALAILQLSNNALRTLDASFFDHLTELQALHLDGNLFTELTENMLLGPNLYRLSMNNMLHLRAIRNNSFARLPKLKEFSATENYNLTVIEVTAFGGDDSSLLKLDLSKNFLQTLDRGAVHWKRLQQLNLKDNPWVCDCKLEWMKEVYMPDTARAEIKCAKPDWLRGKPIESVNVDWFTCERDHEGFWVANKQRFATGILVMGGFLVALVTFATVQYYRHTLMPCFYTRPGRYVSLYSKKGMRNSEVTIAYQDEETKPLTYDGNIPTATTV